LGKINHWGENAWGQLAWNALTTEWGGPYIPQVAIGQQINVTGQQLNIKFKLITILV
jgi:hypothetical protein